MISKYEPPTLDFFNCQPYWERDEIFFLNSKKWRNFGFPRKLEDCQKLGILLTLTTDKQYAGVTFLVEQGQNWRLGWQCAWNRACCTMLILFNLMSSGKPWSTNNLWKPPILSRMESIFQREGTAVQFVSYSPTRSLGPRTDYSFVDSFTKHVTRSYFFLPKFSYMTCHRSSDRMSFRTDTLKRH